MISMDCYRRKLPSVLGAGTQSIRDKLTMTRQDHNQNEELVLYCDVTTEKTVYRIQPGLTSGGFYRNRKKARKVLENSRNKVHKENGSVYERSVSVPALGGQTGTSPMTSPESRPHHNKLRVVLPPPNAHLRPGGRHASEGQTGTERSLSTYAHGHHSMDYDNNPATPGTPKDYLTSPPVDSAASFEIQGGNSSAEAGGLFFYKKESERRSKLIDILTEDASKLCEIWQEDQMSNQKNCLSLEQMHRLATVMREYISSRDAANLDKYLQELVNETVSCDLMSLEELQRSIYSLNEASVKILKERQMPPHWMFAFDDFLKNTIKHAIEFLTPELRSDDSVDGETTPQLHSSSSITLINGTMTGVDLDGSPITKYRKVSQDDSAGKFQDIQRLQEEYARSQEHNVELLKELNKVDKNYQQLLRGVLRERQAHVQHLADSIAMPPPTPLAIGTPSIYSVDSPPPSNSDSQPDSPDISIGVPHLTTSQFRPDEKLVRWLEQLHCDHTTISKFNHEEYTFNDVMELVSREDLRRMNLRGGVECRIWREIFKARQAGNHKTVINSNMDSD